MAQQEKYRFNLFYTSDPLNTNYARALRKVMTPAEKKLWQHLKNKKVYGFHFRRQHQIGQFITDFYCHEAKLVIEVDGEIHLKIENKRYDNTRDQIMIELGIKILRFTNADVLNNIELVINTIKANLIKFSESISPNPSP